MKNKLAAGLLDKIDSRKAVVGVVGLGYVGLPLAIEFARNGFAVTGFDVDSRKVEDIRKGRQYIKHIPADQIKLLRDAPGCSATTDFSKLSKVDCIIICVPTPLTASREPDMTYVCSTTETIAKYLQKGQLVILESTTYPGTTRELLMPMLQQGGLKAGKEFFLAFSPEREDPGNANYSTSTIPKVVGGHTASCRKLACTLYGAVVCDTVEVSSPDAAEATKLLENIFRSVNIAMVNELKVVFDRMGIDIWEVIGAAKTKPFGFMPFYPGPGLGGHCIPIDPFYLTWKARQYGCTTRFIELAGEVNTAMPEYVVSRLVWALNKHKKSLNGSKVLILGIAYKKDVDDDRESPSLRLIELLKREGAKVAYHDPHVPVLKKSRKYDFGLKSTPLTAAKVKGFDVVLVATAHSSVDYALVGEHAPLIVDTRNTMDGLRGIKAQVVKA